jgi:hypothetical protein
LLSALLATLAQRPSSEDVFSVAVTRFFDELHKDHVHVDMVHYRTDGSRWRCFPRQIALRAGGSGRYALSPMAYTNLEALPTADTWWLIAVENIQEYSAKCGKE